MSKCKLYNIPQGLAVSTPFDKAFVNALKMEIPSHERAWSDKNSNPKNTWIVHPKHGARIARLIQHYFGEQIVAPAYTIEPPKKEEKLFRLRYVGVAKQREDGTYSSFGMSDQDSWNLIFPKDVLMMWFKNISFEGTLYDVLGLDNSRSLTDDEIKSAYRRMARQWHPDVCREPNAHERFIQIKEAYDLLGDPIKRKRYDAGLLFVGKQGGGIKAFKDNEEFIPPLRCGMVKVICHQELGRFVVDKILSWDDITDNSGRTLVTSWDYRNQRLVEEWIW